MICQLLPTVRAEARTVGLMNPMGFLPIARRASLTAERMAAVTGDEADVPYTE